MSAEVAKALATEATYAARDAAIFRRCGTVTIGIVLFTLSYATARYVVFGPWSSGQIPIYVLNKSFAWSSVVLIAIAAALGPLARLSPKRWSSWVWQRKYYGLFGFALATAHMFLALLIFNYRYFQAMFVNAFELTPLAVFAMSCGVMTWLLLVLPAVASIPSVQEQMSRAWWLRVQAIVPFALALGAAHVLYGAASWLKPEIWPRGLPPITLINALIVVATLVLRLVARIRNAGSQGSSP